LLPVGHGGVAFRLRGVTRQGRVHGRRRGRVPLNEPETERIVRNRGKSKTNHKESWRSLPPTCAGAAPFCLFGGASPVAATRHWFLELRWWRKRQAWIGKGLKAKGSMKS
jgi:hypothetical protein